MRVALEPHGRERSVWRMLAAAAAALVVFVVAAAAGLILHLGAPTGRRLVARIATEALANSFRGRMTIERIGAIGYWRFGGITVRLADPEGTPVLLVQDLDARINLVRLARSLVGKRGPMDIELTTLDIGYVDASVDSDASGTLRIQRALEPRQPSAPSSSPSRPTRIVLGDAHLAHAWIHGLPPNQMLVDAELDNLSVHADIGPEARRVDVPGVEIATRSLPRGANVSGQLGGNATIPVGKGAKLVAEAFFDGSIGGIPTDASGVVDGDTIDAVIVLARTPSERVRRLDARVPLFANVGAHVEVHGTLPELGVIAHLDVGEGRVDADGTVRIANGVSIKATTQARGIDVRAFSPSAPPSDLSADASGNATLPKDGQPRGSVELEVLPGSVATQRVPHATFSGELDGERGSLRGAIDEPGAPVKLSASLANDVVDAHLRVDVPDLERVRRLRVPLRGSASLDAKARVGLAERTLDATLTATADNLESGDKELRHGSVEGRATGALQDPSFDVTARLTGVAIAGRAIERGTLTARGTMRRFDARVSAEGRDPQHLEAVATIARERTTTRIRDARLEIQRNDERARATVQGVTIGKRLVEIDGLSVEGFGEPVRGSARYTPTAGSVALTAPSIDLVRVARFAVGSKTSNIREGRLSFDVDVSSTRREATGHVVADASAALIDGNSLAAHVNLGLLGTRIVGAVDGSYDEVGQFALTTNSISVSRGLLDPAGWKDATGDLRIESRMNLERLAKTAAGGALPLTEMKGKVSLRGDLTRAREDDAPSLSMTLRTKGLALAGAKHRQTPVDKTQVVEKPGWRIAGVDVALDLDANGTSGETTMLTTLSDRYGGLANVNVRATLPYRALARRLPTVRDDLEHAPFFASVTVPRRPLANMPPMFMTHGLPGDLALEMQAQGSLLEPKVDLVAQSRGLRTSQAQSVPPVDVDLHLAYHDDHAVGQVAVRAANRAVLAASSDLRARLVDFVRGPAGSAPWAASAHVCSTGFPLEVVPFIAERRVKGYMTGDVALSGLHDNARAKADIQFQGLAIGDAQFTAARVALAADEKRLEADVRLDQKDGFAQAKASLGTRWGARLAPSPDRSQPADVTFSAERLRLAAIFPFVQGTFSELDGRADANARFHLDANHKHPVMQGTMKIDHGRFQIPSMGEGYHGVTGTITLQPDGQLKVEHLTARGVTGRMTAAASARLDGFDVVGARAQIRIPKQEPLPLAPEGEPLGDVSGSIDVAATRQADQSYRIDVTVPRLDVALPDTKRHDLQPLEGPDHVRIGTHRAPGKLTVLPLGPPEQPRDSNAPRLAILVHLRDVEVRRGPGLRVRLSGDPRIDLDSDRRVSGTITLNGGFLEVQGKRFEIERGTVTFVDDPTNPEVVVTAGWTAPEGTRVYADFVGPLKTGKATLRSEPSHTQDEILALILFGTPEGLGAATPPGQEPSAAARAAGLGGGILTQGLNKALDDLTGVEVTTRIDTTNAAAPRPEIEIRIARDISMQLEHVLGVPPPGDNPDKNFVKFDWRFKRGFTVETTFGDKGSSIFDLIWRKRY